MESDTFCGDSMVKLVWRLPGVFFVGKDGNSNYQTISTIILP